MGENLLNEWESAPAARAIWFAIEEVDHSGQSGLDALQMLASNGSSLAMYYLGEILAFGKYGLNPDRLAGMDWLQLSADAGSIEGAFLLAKMRLDDGKLSSAHSLLQCLGEQSFSPAIFRLGFLHVKGEQAPKDIDAGMAYFEAASAIGHVHAKMWIAYLLLKGNRGWKGRVLGFLKRLALPPYVIAIHIKNPDSDLLRM